MMASQSFTRYIGPSFIMLPLLLSAQFYWYSLVQTHIPEPYLDEIFHIPQAQTYWRGDWKQWDPKITTPPGVYLASYLLAWIWKVIYPVSASSEAKPVLETADLRLTNVVLANALLLSLYAWGRVSGRKQRSASIGPSGAQSFGCSVEATILTFPLLFFFSALYYTDVFSALTVLVSYTVWKAGVNAQSRGHRVLWQVAHLISGLVSLASRQTNIFWVAVFLGGLQLFETVKAVRGNVKIYDPPISQAYIEDFVSTVVSLLQSILYNIVPLLPTILLDLWPQLMLLLSFALFVLYNGGVVLGDKSNHVATIHLPQMLYLWAFVAFFTWPAMIPRMAQLFNDASGSGWRGITKQLPRVWILALFSGLGLAIVKYNTIVHPFTLADNRHYVFYVFRLLLRKTWWVRYAVVPFYIICGWITISALGGESTGPEHGKKTEPSNRASSKGKSTKSPDTPTSNLNRTSSQSITVSFVLVWLISTALSLITAPLVEPRYFIVPWLIWRMNIPNASSREIGREIRLKSGKALREEQGMIWNFMATVLLSLAKYRLWIELVWYMLINFGTCYMFLYRGFTWVQEPGKVQRFMW